MRECWKMLAAAGLMVGGLAHNASANVTFSVSGVTTISANSSLVSLAGSFTTNDARSSIISFDITAPASGAFLGYEYTSANSTVSAATLPSQYFRIDSGANQLQFFFASGLSSTGGVLVTNNSYDHEPSGGNRLLSGSVSVATTPPTATPEPLSLATLASGLVAMVVMAGGLARRRTGSRSA